MSRGVKSSVQHSDECRLGTMEALEADNVCRRVMFLEKNAPTRPATNTELTVFGAASTASDSDIHFHFYPRSVAQVGRKFHQAGVPEGRDLHRWRLETMKMRDTREDSRTKYHHWKQMLQNSEELKGSVLHCLMIQAKMGGRR